MPGYLDSIIDPISNVSIKRITGDAGTPVSVIGDTWPDDQWGARSAYSTHHAWSADGKIVFLSTYSIFLDDETYTPLRYRGYSGLPQWGPSEKDIMWYVIGNKVYRWNVRTNSKENFTITGYSSLHIDVRSSPSKNGQFLAVDAIRNSDNAKVAIVIDPVNKQKIGVDITSAMAGDMSDSYTCDITPSGKYLRTSFTGVNNASIWWDYITGAKVSEVVHDNIECPGHGDHAIDVDGKDVMVGV